VGKLIKKLGGAGRKASKVLVAEGKKSVRRKVTTVRKVTRKAIKTGILTGALAAAGVVAREIRKRRKN
jgi:hypothetical protein